MYEIHLIRIDGIVRSVTPVARLWLMPCAFDCVFAKTEALQEIIQVAVKSKTNSISVGRSNISGISDDVQLPTQELDGKDLVTTSRMVPSVRQI